MALVACHPPFPDLTVNSAAHQRVWRVISPRPGHGGTGDTYRYLLTWMKTEILGDRLHLDAATGRAKEDVQGVGFTYGESRPL